MGRERLLVLNAGSSSLKWQLFGLQPFAASIGGLLDRIGDTSKSTLSAKTLGGAAQQRWKEQVPVQDHVSGMQMILQFLRNTVSNTIQNEVAAVGHRIVHGLDMHKAMLVDDTVLDTIRRATTLAPLHNPAGLQGIAAAQRVFQGVPQVCVFDTAFHQTMPPTAYTYGLPHELCDQHMIRRYGFHGTSHKYLAEQAAQRLGKPVGELNAIICHLGNGSSITAVKNGVSVDTSMGLTPLEGLLMGTRSGDLDPAVPLHLINALGMSAKEVDTMLNKKSGLLGVCGQSDLRSVIELQQQGDERASLALSMFVYRVQKYIGAFTAVLGGRVDAVVFSAGIGENSSIARGLICEGLQGLGMELDAARNDAAVGGASADISSGASRVRMLVIPTDEELSIAQQTLEVVSGLQDGGGMHSSTPAAAKAA